MDRAAAPDQRPPWFVVLSSLMLMLGGVQVGSAASVLFDPGREAESERLSVKGTDADRALAYQYNAQQVEVFRQHRGAMRGLAAARLGAGLLMLYAAASALIRDRRGRTFALLAALAAIPYHGLSVLLGMRLWREIGLRLAPWLEEALRASGTVKPEDLGKSVAAHVQALQYKPVLPAVAGVVFSLVVLWYFGGRKGRQLYGIHRLGR